MKKIYKAFSLVFMVLFTLTLVACSTNGGFTDEEREFVEDYRSVNGGPNESLLGSLATVTYYKMVAFNEGQYNSAYDLELVEYTFKKINLLFKMYEEEFELYEAYGIRKEYPISLEFGNQEVFYDLLDDNFQLNFARYEFEKYAIGKNELAEIYNEDADKYPEYFELERPNVKRKLPRQLELITEE